MFRIISTKRYIRLVALEKEVGNLADLVVLKGQSYPCDKCNIETSACRKLHFSDRTICVISKQYMVKPPKQRKL